MQLLFGFENNQTVRFKWTKVNDMLDMSRRLRISENTSEKSDLIIREVVESDQGMYFCTAYNEYGNHTEEVFLYVKTYWSFIIPLIVVLVEILAIIIITYAFKPNKNSNKLE